MASLNATDLQTFALATGINVQGRKKREADSLLRNTRAAVAPQIPPTQTDPFCEVLTPKCSAATIKWLPLYSTVHLHCTIKIRRLFIVQVFEFNSIPNGYKIGNYRYNNWVNSEAILSAISILKLVLRGGQWLQYFLQLMYIFSFRFWGTWKIKKNMCNSLTVLCSVPLQYCYFVFFHN